MTVTENISNRFVIAMLFVVLVKMMLADAKADVAINQNACALRGVTPVTAEWQRSVK
jgi:hypothetical protein